jgi:hypothetical protein
MILQPDFAHDYLLAFKRGEISQGKGIDLNHLDTHLRYKQGQFVAVLGLSNVGKTMWMLWYLWKLSEKYGLTWCLLVSENNPSSAVRSLIQFKTGRSIIEMTEAEIFRHATEISMYFKFISIDRLYTPNNLFDLFKEAKTHGALIDPYSGLDRKYTHEYNYDFLTSCRVHSNSTKQTLYVCMHPNTEAARRRHKSGDCINLVEPPDMADAEGGTNVANRVDDFITIHRYTKHPALKTRTMIFVQKVKEQETGGLVTNLSEPVEFDFNYGKGFLPVQKNEFETMVQGYTPYYEPQKDEDPF